MNPRFLELYDVELQHLRRLAGEFARHRPQTGRQLGLDVEGRQLCQDPFVERLLEGFSFLAARVHYQLDSEFPRFTQGLLETVYPDYLAPLPSAGVVRFPIDPEAVFDRHEIPAGSEVVTDPFGPRATRCQWRTTQDLTLLPLRIANVEYRSGHGDLGVAHEAALGIRLELLNPAMSWADLACDRLRFFVAGSDQNRLRLLAHVVSRGRGVLVAGKTAGRREVRRVPDSVVRQLGFDASERLLPASPAGFEGYRLLREYFLLPEKFHFFEVSGLEPALAGLEGEIEIILPFSEDDPSLQAVVGKKSLELFATPLVNLFPMSRRFDFDPRRPEHHVTIDRTRAHDYEIYSIEEATGYGMKSGDATTFRPFFFNQAADGAADQAFYLVKRDAFPRASTGTVLPHLGYPGSEVYLSLVDLKAAPFRLDIRQLGVAAQCTNRHLPLMMIENGLPRFTYPESQMVRPIEFLTGPTPPVPSIAEGQQAWRIISHLALNYQSLAGADGDASALRELLALYCEKNRREVRALRSVRSISKQALHRFDSGPPSFVRGMEIVLGFDQNVMSPPEILLFSRVLEEFFGRYVSINCFTQTSVALLPNNKELIRWPRRIGKTSMI